MRYGLGLRGRGLKDTCVFTTFYLFFIVSLKSYCVMKTKRNIKLAEISEKIFKKFGYDRGIELICTLSAAALVKLLSDAGVA